MTTPNFDQSVFHRYDDILFGFLESHKIVLEKYSYEFLKLRGDFILALIKATEIEKERVQGNFNIWYDDFPAPVKKNHPC